MAANNLYINQTRFKSPLSQPGQFEKPSKQVAHTFAPQLLHFA